MAWMPTSLRESFVDRMARRMMEREARRKATLAASPPPPPDLTPEERAARRRADHAAAVDRELAAIDARVAELDRVIARAAGAPPEGLVFAPAVFNAGERVSPLAPAASHRDLEAAAERRMLRELRGEIASERDAPIERDRDGRPISDAMLAHLKYRAREMAEVSRDAAERAAREGDHRRARRHRVDALRSRMIAEYEMHLRPFLAGYSQPWN